MPKIRDLGINVIPETMRPPEIGAGGGGGCEGATSECGENTYEVCPAGTFQCGPDTAYQQQCPAGTLQCGPDTAHQQQCAAGTFRCEPGTYYHDQCPGGTIPCTAGTLKDTPEITRMAAAYTGKPEAVGLTREAIKILKQQLQHQIAQLEELARSLDSDEK